LWHGATENSTLVRELLADLRERGLNCGFRRKRTLIPKIIGHRFRSKSDSSRSEATLGG
jgi:hypothetical protein